MSKRYDRHLEILNILFAGKRIKCKSLASKFDVSIKTIKQDISELSLYYPIITYSGYGGGVEMQKGFALNGYIMKRKYLELIFAALYKLKETNNDPELTSLINMLQSKN